MSNRPTRNTLKGIWVAVPLAWDEQYRFDESTFRETLRRLLEAKVHGLYTFGSTGELYAIDDDEFCRITDIFLDEVGPRGVPTQVGCHGTATHQIVRKLQYARQAGADGAQVALPFWMELTDQEILNFWADISAAVPNLPLTSYNSGRTKVQLTGEQYRRILQVAPNLIGIKWPGELDLETFPRIAAMTPELVHFVGERYLVEMMKQGVARGNYNASALWQPELTVQMFELAEAGKWAEAEQIGRRFADVISYVLTVCEELGLGMMDPVIDKGLMATTGILSCHQRTRPPYIGWSDAGVAEMRVRLKAKFPWLIPA
jgi:dihydrodipicolinate synthase/N-acetylneuraminate lyase